MSRIELSRAPEWELVHDSQDVRGWPVVDAVGQTVGKVKDLIIDTESERVSSLLLDTGAQVAAREVSLGDHYVTMGATGARATSKQKGAVDRGGSAELRLPVIEEQLRIGKRTVESGGVRVESHLQERPVQGRVDLRQEHVSVGRHPVNRPASEADVRAAGQGTVDVTARSKEAVVDKPARVQEEVVVKKDVEQRTDTIRDKVHRTDVNVGKLSSDEASREKRKGS